jgi:hypothetical protein
MRVNGYRCDQCQKEHLLTHEFVNQHMIEKLPCTWFFVTMGGSIDREPWVFCSRECLIQYAVFAEGKAIA